MDADIGEHNNINYNVASLTAAILRSAVRSIPRGNRRDYKPFWSPKLQELHSRLSTARDKQEEDPTPENTAAYNTIKEEYDEEKKETADLSLARKNSLSQHGKGHNKTLETDEDNQ